MRFSILFILLTLSGHTYALSEIDSLKTEVARLRSSLAFAEGDSLKTLYNDSLKVAVGNFLDADHSFDHQLDTVSFMGDLFSPDRAFRMITWNVPWQNGTFVYLNFLQTYNKRTGETEWYECIDSRDVIGSRFENKNLKPNKWMGALYYDIIPTKDGKDVYYTLLGWDGSSPRSNKKIIETLYFDGRNQPRFGAPILDMPNGKKKRIVYEYHKQASMTIMYNHETDQIIVDHLAPMQDGLEGMYSYYIPDMTFNGFKWKKGKWLFEEDVEFNAPKTDRPFYDPRN